WEVHMNRFIDFCSQFQKNVNQNPLIEAVIYQNDRLTYQELNEVSSKFAQRLIHSGLKTGDIVALGVYNDIDLIPAVLGIWKAGGVYLPIDPNYPIERIKMILSDAN